MRKTQFAVNPFRSVLHIKSKMQTIMESNKALTDVSLLKFNHFLEHDFLQLIMQTSRPQK